MMKTAFTPDSRASSYIPAVPDDRSMVAHVLRRTTFGPFPGQIDAAAGSGASVAIDTVLAAPPLDAGEPALIDDSDNDADFDRPVRRWLSLMANRNAGIHEKMVWFWHGHLTSSYDKVGVWRMMWRQHLLLRQHALGNFREMVQAITVDPAMLVYLDGAESTADAPNENYGRELMELFTIGRGNYGQDDVHAAATALAGWQVDDRRATASFDSESGNNTPVTFLGNSVVRASDIVDVVCNHSACPPFIAAKLHRFLAGEDPSPERLQHLADVFASSGLEIRPLVEAIVRDESFLELRMNRPRYPVEWVIAALGTFGIDKPRMIYEHVSTLGQVPFYPPNVAGWPPGPRWVSASHALARAALAAQAPAIAEVRDAADPVAAAFERGAVYEPTPPTRASVEKVADAVSTKEDPDDRAAVILATVVSSPEFALA